MKSWWIVWSIAALLLVSKFITNVVLPPDAILLEWIALGRSSLDWQPAGLGGWMDGAKAALASFGFSAGGLTLAHLLVNLWDIFLFAIVLFGGIAVVALLARFVSRLRWPLFVVVLFFLGWISSSLITEWSMRFSVRPVPADLLATGGLPALAGEAEQLAGEDGVIWANPTAVRYLEFLAPSTPVLPLETALETAGSPVFWRARMRETSPGAVLLLAPHSEHRSLLDHLAVAPDWKIAKISATGILFVPSNGANVNVLPDLNELSQGRDEPDEVAYQLARIAENLAAVGENGAARRFFDAAIRIAPERPDLRCMFASFLATRGQLFESGEIAGQVLEQFPNYPAALQVRIQAELGAGNANAAWEAALALEKLQPNDPFSLFLVAKAANAAGGLAVETRALEQLIRVVSRQQLPTANYRIYLGQAFARQGFASAAVEQWDLAEKSGNLTPAQAENLKELRESLLPTARMENPLPTETPLR